MAHSTTPAACSSLSLGCSLLSLPVPLVPHYLPSPRHQGNRPRTAQCPDATVNSDSLTLAGPQLCPEPPVGSHPLALLLSPQLPNLLLPSHPKQMTLLLPHREHCSRRMRGPPAPITLGLPPPSPARTLSLRPFPPSDISIGFSSPHHRQPQGMRFRLWKNPVRKGRAET